MNQNLNQEIEVEEAYAEFFGVNDKEYSQEYLDFINSLDVAPVIFDKDEIIEDFLPNVYQENWWDEDEVNLFEINDSDKFVYQTEEDFWVKSNNEDYDYDFPQPEPKYFKVSPFELIPQKRYLVF